MAQYSDQAQATMDKFLADQRYVVIAADSKSVGSDVARAFGIMAWESGVSGLTRHGIYQLLEERGFKKYGKPIKFKGIKMVDGWRTKAMRRIDEQDRQKMKDARAAHQASTS